MTERVVVSGDELPGEAYLLLNRLVIPRPIAWVSTTSADGIDNLAPHSFYTVSAVQPDPIVQFTSIGHKDTLRNVLATGEFVVNLTPASLIEEVNATSIDAPRSRSEFDQAGLERRPSVVVGPPSVAASPAAIECRLVDTKAFGDDTVVFGRVVAITVAADAMRDGWPDAPLLDPVARLGGNEWATLGEISARERPRWSALAQEAQR